MYKFKIDKIKFTNDLEIIPKKINIIIGPNNSGKSKCLKEIADKFHDIKDFNYIIKEIEYKCPENYEEFYHSYKLDEKIIENENYRKLRVYSNYEDNTYPSLQKDQTYKINLEKNIFLRDFGRLFVNYLGTENRLTMVKKTEYNSSIFSNMNFLSDLYNSCKYSVNTIEEEMSKEVKKLFKKDIVLDKYTELGKLRFRISNDFEYFREGKFGDSEIIKKLNEERWLDKEGDGLKSFVSTFLSLKYNNKDIILIDEPEAFLHPPLARQLGEIIGNTNNNEKQIFITTHSSEILKGVLSTCKDINVIRVTREENANIITKLDSEKLSEIINKPRLRVSKILDGLFCEKVVITEAESDEIFYQELLEKIEPQSGVFFVHVNSKHNILEVSQIYNALKINNVMVFDFDVIRNNSDEFKNLLENIGISETKIKEFVGISKQIDLYFDTLVKDIEIEDEQKEKKRKLYHQSGYNELPSELKEKTERMLMELTSNNIFINKNGELETSLKEFGIEYTSNKKAWISQAIEVIDIKSKEELECKEIGKFVLNFKK